MFVLCIVYENTYNGRLAMRKVSNFGIVLHGIWCCGRIKKNEMVKGQDHSSVRKLTARKLY